MLNPPFIATIGYVRSLKISRLSVTSEGKRAGGWPCYHYTILPIPKKMADGVTLHSDSGASAAARAGRRTCGRTGASTMSR